MTAKIKHVHEENYVSMGQLEDQNIKKTYST
jgi:hypothetical protein